LFFPLLRVADIRRHRRCRDDRRFFVTHSSIVATCAAYIPRTRYWVMGISYSIYKTFWSATNLCLRYASAKCGR
jgi:hypothetical protein